jgi:hypothetical protein
LPLLEPSVCNCCRTFMVSTTEWVIKITKWVCKENGKGWSQCWNHECVNLAQWSSISALELEHFAYRIQPWYGIGISGLRCKRHLNLILFKFTNSLPTDHLLFDDVSYNASPAAIFGNISTIWLICSFAIIAFDTLDPSLHFFNDLTNLLDAGDRTRKHLIHAVIKTGDF